MEPARQQLRYRVNFSVRFGAAREFVQEYAENLSTGGLFVRGAHRLEKDEQVVIEIDLPGFETFIVTAKVAHVIGPAEAAAADRKPGAGLQITSTPKGFQDAMRSYLLRLGRRRDYMALVGLDSLRTMLEEAGFQTRPVPAPNALTHVITSVGMPLVAIVVPEALYEHYAKAAEAAGIADLVSIADTTDGFEELLRTLDQRIEPVPR